MRKRDPMAARGGDALLDAQALATLRTPAATGQAATPARRHVRGCPPGAVRASLKRDHSIRMTHPVIYREWMRRPPRARTPLLLLVLLVSAVVALAVPQGTVKAAR